MKTVYYLEHVTQRRRLKHYASLAGARIAQANRNRHLGFKGAKTRYIDDDNRECELYTDQTGTWCIVEDTIDSQYDSLVEPETA